MAASSFNPQQQISTHVYAPNNAGFINPHMGQFTHFDSNGRLESFGMPCDELAKQMKKFVVSFLDKHKELFYQQEFVTLASQVEFKLRAALQEIETLHLQMKNKTRYTEPHEMAPFVIDTGYIPIALSAISPAKDFNRAARTISPNDVAIYFQKFPNAKSQAREYCFKVAMMNIIGKLREDIVALRYTFDQQQNSTVICNRLIIDLDEKIIAANQGQLPAEYTQFDLLDTFLKRVHELICQLDAKANTKTQHFIDGILSLLNSTIGNTYSAQEKTSSAIYQIMEIYVRNDIGIGGPTELTFEQDDMLQAVLPLIEYMNSAQNPFARNGLFGVIATSESHKRALKAYSEHEKEQSSYFEKFSYQYQPRSSHVEYNDAQIGHLLDGNNAAGRATKSAKQSSVKGAFGNLFISGAGSTQSSSSNSQSGQRRQLLALPQPEQYQSTQLLLTYIPAPAPQQTTQTGMKKGGKQ